MSTPNSHELLIRIDERTKRIKSDIEEVKIGLQGMHKKCDSRVLQITKDVGVLKKNYNGELSGRDKALVYGSLITAASGVLVALISYFK